MPTESRSDSTREHSWKRDVPWRPPQSRTRADKEPLPDQDDPAYRYGHEFASRYVGRHWDEVEPELRRAWDRWEHRGDSAWDEVKHNVREAYHRASEP
jgi:hypothetical protein